MKRKTRLGTTDVLGSYLRRRGSKPVTRADLFIGIPLTLVLAIGIAFYLRRAWLSGEISLGRGSVAQLGSDPFWFALGIFLHLLLIVFLLLAPIGFVHLHRRQQNED